MLFVLGVGWVQENFTLIYFMHRFLLSCARRLYISYEVKVKTYNHRDEISTSYSYVLEKKNFAKTIIMLSTAESDASDCHVFCVYILSIHSINLGSTTFIAHIRLTDIRRRSRGSRRRRRRTWMLLLFPCNNSQQTTTLSTRLDKR